ncbi:MAG: phospholipase D family protein, partial [Xanthomonadales bacterium]|nr:phospholipase D family protein [Xanthomonadales bacterium]
LASNNHTPVHAAYAGYRRRMIDAGVELYELRVDSSKLPEGSDQPGYDSVTLHVKALLIDHRHTFVGSLNLDPRSIDINTEMGVLVDNEELAGGMTDRVLENLPSFAYRVTQNENGRLRWTTVIDGEEIVETSEPQASRWLRFKAFLMRILPEGQL